MWASPCDTKFAAGGLGGGGGGGGGGGAGVEVASIIFLKIIIFYPKFNFHWYGS